ncbi:MAG: hypothetical protein ACJ74O_20745 [Frankiaceae bacterium]
MARALPYPAILDGCRDRDGTVDRRRLSAALIDAWAGAYGESVAGAALHEIPIETVTYLFDYASSRELLQEDRAVAVVGESVAAAALRDAAYQRGHPRPAPRAGRPVDKGHLVPHSGGGVLHVNLFPQDRALNRGWSEEGKAYRAMEREIAVPGTFFFCRLLYDDGSWFPRAVELGVLRDSGLATRCFQNRFD